MSARETKKAYEILDSYAGENDHILALQRRYKQNHYSLNEFEVSYINKNYDYKRDVVNKTVKISDIFGLDLQERFNLDFVPTKVRLYDIIGEMGASYHCRLQFRQSVPPVLMYVKKRHIIEELHCVDYESMVVDFDQFDNKTKKEGRALREHQKVGVKFLLANRKCVLADSMGLGKSLPCSEIVATPDGWKTIGSMGVGDKVFGSDGKPHNIIGVFPQGNLDVYEVEFLDGAKVRCSTDHLWTVRYADKKKLMVKTLKEMMDEGFERKTNKEVYFQYRFHVPFCKPVEYTEKEYIVAPYIMGWWLAEGLLRLDRPVFTELEKQEDALEKIGDLLPDGLEAVVYGHPACHVGIYPKNDDWTSTEFVSYTAEFSNFKNFLQADRSINFIPDKYKYGSVEQRLELLRGLMDADGETKTDSNNAMFYTDSPQLAQDVAELVIGLGGIAKAHQRNSEDPYDWKYVTVIQFATNPFWCKNKASGYAVNEKDTIYTSRPIKSARLVENVPCVCIKVDSPDETFLTRNYVVTHNTTTAVVSALASKSEKVLIICPATMKTTWKKEIAYYEDRDNIQIISGSKWDSQKKFTIINFDILKNFYVVPTEDVFEEQEAVDAYGNISTVFVPVMKKNRNNGRLEQKQKKTTRKDIIEDALSRSKLFQEKFDCVIIDEAQKLSNSTSERYRIMEDFLKRIKANYVFLLTGTPLTNNPKNLYNVLRLINAPITADYNYFMERYCDGHTIKLKNGKEFMKTGNATNLDELKDRIKHLYIRRLISDIPDMVGKSVSARYYDLDERQCAEYERLWQDYLDSQDAESSADSEDYRQLVEGGLVRRYLANEMVDNTIQLVNELLEDTNKVIIVCTFQDEVDKFKDYYKSKSVVYDGRITSAKKKDEAVDRFMNDPKVRVFIGNIAASSTGLTLTEASKMVFNSYSWSEVDNRQMQDRIWRLTQKEDCEIIYQLWTDSISSDMWERVIHKGLIMDTVIKKEDQKD